MSDLHLILLPGLDGSGVLFRPILDHFPPGFRPLVVRYPPDEPLGYEELLPIVMAALPTNAPFALVGESFSGPLALMAAATRPPNLIAVILCASFVRNPLRLRSGFLHHLVRPFLFRLYPKAKLARVLLAGRSTRELRSLTAEALAGLRPEVLAHRVRAVMRVNVTSQLAACPVPILYLRAKYDLVVPGHNVAEMIRIRRSMQVKCVPSPHAILQSVPAESAAEITSFLHGISTLDSAVDSDASVTVVRARTGRS